MNYNEKLESLAKEFDATVNHAVEVMEQYIATAIEKEVMDAIDKLSQEEKEMLLVFTMLDELMQSQPEPEPEKDDDDDFQAKIYKEEKEQMEIEQLKEKQITEEMLKHLFRQQYMYPPSNIWGRTYKKKIIILLYLSRKQ